MPSSFTQPNARINADSSAGQSALGKPRPFGHDAGSVARSPAHRLEQISLAPTETAPIQRLTYGRFQGWGALTNWRYNDQERRLNQHETRLDTRSAAMAAHEADEDHGDEVTRLRARIATIKQGTHQQNNYDGLENEMGQIHNRLGQISGLIDTRNRQRAQVAADADSARIFGARKDIHKELSRKSTSAERRSELMGQLDNLQQEHIGVIDRVHSQNLRLWLPEQVSARTRNRVNTDWDTLRHESGNLKTAEGSSEQFKKEMRAMHAQLLYGKHGRSLISGILRPQDSDPEQGPLVIKPTASDPANQEQRRDRARLKHRLHSELQLGRLERERKDFEHGVVKLQEQHRGKIPQEHLEGLGKEDLRLSQQEQLAKHEIDKAGGEAAFSAPSPAHADSTGKEISVRQGLRDGEMVNDSFGGRLTAAPAHIIYGHELIHSLRHRTGESKKKEKKAFLDRMNRKYDTSEERDTILGMKKSKIPSENLLRREHGIAPRQWHTSKTREDIDLAGGVYT